MRLLIGVASVLLLSSVAFAQTKQDAVVKLVDPAKGKMLVAVTSKEGGTKIVEYDIGKDVKFLDEKGKPLKDGLKNDAFKSSNNRPAVPISITFNKDGSMKSVKLSPPPK